jgi:hypothetical protein
MSGTLFLDYYNKEQGQSQPAIRKTDVLRGMLANVSFSRSDVTANPNYPDTGLRSDVCVMDFSGGRKLQKGARTAKEAQAAPDLFVTSKALLLMPDGTMQTITTEPELFK